MIHIKRFIDKVTSTEGKQGKDVVIPIHEARGLRDELAKLLIDRVEKNNMKESTPEVIEIQVVGGKFK
jgi:hypothetical protein